MPPEEAETDMARLFRGFQAINTLRVVRKGRGAEPLGYLMPGLKSVP